MQAAHEEDGPGDLGFRPSDELQDLVAALGAWHQWQPSLLPPFRREEMVA